MIKRFLYIVLAGLLLPLSLFSQINAERVMTIGKIALYFEDDVIYIQVFNKVINANPYLA